MEGFQKYGIPSAPEKGFRIQILFVQFYQSVPEIPGQDLRIPAVYGCQAAKNLRVVSIIQLLNAAVFQGLPGGGIPIVRNFGNIDIFFTVFSTATSP